mmetsp:Transcript_26536/g.42071  ORF Transcript_26536/g.42071 Transcript_26536/m.42071 type:complete len:372 (-) Transcript_26536:22-1137(-)
MNVEGHFSLMSLLASSPFILGISRSIRIRSYCLAVAASAAWRPSQLTSGCRTPSRCRKCWMMSWLVFTSSTLRTFRCAKGSSAATISVSDRVSRGGGVRRSTSRDRISGAVSKGTLGGVPWGSRWFTTTTQGTGESRRMSACSSGSRASAAQSTALRLYCGRGLEVSMQPTSTERTVVTSIPSASQCCLTNVSCTPCGPTSSTDFPMVSIGAAFRSHGPWRVKENLEPTSLSLSSASSVPMALHRYCVITSPRPVPCLFICLFVKCTCPNSFIMHWRWAWEMPMPVSVTAKCTANSSPTSSTRTSRETTPASVNLTAFESRLSSTWRRRDSSPTMVTSEGSTYPMSSFFDFGREEMHAKADSMHCRRSNGL